MDSSFHLQQGQQLLEKQDAISVRKALEHFKTAIEISDDDDWDLENTIEQKICCLVACNCISLFSGATNG